MLDKSKIRESINVENNKLDYILPLGLMASLLLTFILFDNIYVQNEVVIENKDYKLDKSNYIETNQKITEYKSLQEIIENKRFSQVIPRKCIEGYNYENGVLTQKDKVESIHLSFTKDYGYVSVNVQEIKNVSNYTDRIVDANDTDKYNITEYEIPFAESVPQDLRITMDDPIFDSSQITEDVLKKRVVKIQESGESNKQTMRFGVSCGDLLIDYIIAYYGEDSLAKKTYEILMSMPYFENGLKQ